MRQCRVWRIMQIEEDVIHRGWRLRRITSSEIYIIVHILWKPNSIIVLLLIQNISNFFTYLPPRGLSWKLWLISRHEFRKLTDILEGLNGVLALSVICSQFLVFAVKLANFFYVHCFRKNTLKCFGGSSGIFGNDRISSLVLGNLRQSPEIVGSLRSLL